MVLLPLHTVHKEVSLNHLAEKLTLTLMSHISHTQKRYNLKYARSLKYEPFLTCLSILVKVKLSNWAEKKNNCHLHKTTSF